ncbi:hypothetical protein MLD38_007744 [Melastoma candidum]|uniref:Uncharacterized protein n=1 Tax=Melastoma candidum TaxID=119954 RepID=A0ACB9RR94_9MYRT|nr:hypothetical protein MLD38_007744 [Melastoma candidum]
MDSEKPHVVLLSSPGMGHLIPILELGHRLITLHSLRITVLVVATDPSTVRSHLHNQPADVRDLLEVVFLPPVDISPYVGPSTAILSVLVLMMRHSMPLVRSSIDGMRSPRPSALIVDLFATGAFDIAEEFGMLKYVFDTSNAWFLALTVYHPHLPESEENRHVVDHEQLDIPGCPSLVYDDTVDVYMNPENRILHEDYAEMGRDMAKADGILINSWEELEPATLKALRDPKLLAKFSLPSVYPIGPIVRSVEPIGGSSFDCGEIILSWLNKQPQESVLYVSFGSGGTLCIEQMTELAWGLEMSGQRFIWVVRPPTVDQKWGSLFKLKKNGLTRLDDGTPEYLPEGFITRTKEQGLVVPLWAPQTQILAHKATGGFFSHCGWNSTLESIVNGVPMICWPLYAEQKMNATMLSEHLGMAVRSKKAGTDRVLPRKVIETMVREVMGRDTAEGKRLRSTVREIQRMANAALEEGGSSYDALSKVVKQCEIKVQEAKERARGA